jgi:hypothetical protein
VGKMLNTNGHSLLVRHNKFQWKCECYTCFDGFDHQLMIPAICSNAFIHVIEINHIALFYFPVEYLQTRTWSLRTQYMKAKAMLKSGTGALSSIHYSSRESCWVSRTTLKEKDVQDKYGNLVTWTLNRFSKN